ncbi:hypothetical protein HCN44_006592 [Aphidius gifuensis]|uniref:Anaphase-promoting complex subunit 1 n=1 Tax=Aphidius gifuensis TaxID=684658 RepID=A0A834Y0I0_APHGI|nr:anaphase-promoting complex subunit 1 [Aphidius gifuensis]KAF7995485.1 hypothetical protein HCN44_006592 [Aphidius gifuensis]
MIAASDPQDYTPGGRETYRRHPGSVIHQQNQLNPQENDSVLFKKFSQVNITDKSVKEFWITRENDKFGEEELYCCGKVAIHSKGTQSTRVLQTSYTCDTDIKHALWCNFTTTTTDKIMNDTQKELIDDDNDDNDDEPDKTVECICLLDSYTLKVFTEKGEDYVTSLQFQISSVWSTKYGILLEKSQIPLTTSTTTRYPSMDISRWTSTTTTTATPPPATATSTSQIENNLPITFSLTHPLDEICPLLIKNGVNINYMCDTNQQIIFTNTEPSLAVIYDIKNGLHSVYKIRKATTDERQIVCNNDDITNSYYNQSTAASPLYLASSSNKSSATKKNNINLFGNPRLSGIGFDLPNTPFGSRGTSYTSCSGGVQSPSQHQTTHSRSQSPMATISRCQSPTNPTFTPLISGSMGPIIHQTRLHQTVMATIMCQSQNNPNSCNSFHFQDQPITNGKPLYPEICLDHVWTENSINNKDILNDKAKKVFLTSDMVGQSYLCYLITNRTQLYLVRIEKTNKKQKLIFGMITTIIAKDAVTLPSLNMIAILDLTNSVTLYSGINCIGKINITSILSTTIDNNINYFKTSSNNKHLNLSPFPRRSSLISQNFCGHDIKFEEALHSLSPVGGNCARGSILLDNNTSIIDYNNLIGLKDAVGNKITLEYGNKMLQRISLPCKSTSPLVTKCLKTLKCVLQKDIAMQLLVKWYGARNAPGPQDFTLQQEWHLFMVILLTLLGYEVDKLSIIRNNNNNDDSCNPIISKKQKTNDSGTQDDWFDMLNKIEHKTTSKQLSNCLNLMKKNDNDNDENNDEDNVDDDDDDDTKNNGKVSTQAILFPYLPLILFSLHLLYEELKLNCVMSESLPLLAQLLYQLSKDLNFKYYKHYYFIDYPNKCLLNNSPSQINNNDLQKIIIPNYIPIKPPCVFETINNLLNLNNIIIQYPFLNRVNKISKNIIQLTALLSNECNGIVDNIDMEKYIKLIIPVGSRVDYKEIDYDNDIPIIDKYEKPTCERIILLYHKMGMTKKHLDILPPGISLLLKDVMHRCRESPPSNWPFEAYELIDRQDLSSLSNNNANNNNNDINKDKIENSTNYIVRDSEQDDGMTFDDTILKLRFNKDHRVSEVQKLLNSSKPVRISIVQRPEVSDHEFIEEQERHLHALCSRTMSLPVARGMFTLRTSTPIVTEQLPIPRLCLTGKAALRGTTVELSHIDVPQNMNLWPLFHNGVAAGLRIHPSSLNIDSTWIVYNKQQQGEFGIEHSGFLMALGLNGHLKNFSPFSMYEYLVECHETTNVGLLLGLSATYRGTMDVSMTKLLSLHVETLLPPTSIELNVQQNVQVAALMGVGLVYEGTAHRHISHALLSEIGRPPGPEMKNCIDRESYSLAAGLALGLVVLGHGDGSDLTNIPDTLHYYMVGGNVRPFNGSQKDKYKSPSYQIREGDSINIDVTSPGATIALGLMYFNTGNTAVAEWMKAPHTQFLLDFVRPDFLLLRILSKSLILWNDIEPTTKWVSSHVPDIVWKYKLQNPNQDITQNIDLETMNQAYCNIIAGACMALGLKYAGTANHNAFKTLLNYTKKFLGLLNKTIGELAGKSTIETCLNVTLLSASVVMSGTGNLDIMRICRQIRTRIGPTSSVVTYGSHLATHMAIGLLFIGGGRYTLSNSPSSVAALIISLFPKFPTHSNDNRYHLQALRHLYVLAAKPRLILPKDIDTNINCYASIKLTFKNDKLTNGQDIVLRAPCLLPEIDSLEKVELIDDRYWNIIFQRGHNWNLLKDMLNNCHSLYVKQKAGCLSYIEDPHGFRSLIAQTLTTENLIPWAARQEYVTSFTNDKTVLNIVKYFLQKQNNCIVNKYKVSSSNPLFESTTYEKMEINDDINDKQTSHYSDVENNEKFFLQTLAIIVYECVIKDKVSLLPLWVNLYKIIEMIDTSSTSYLIWQIKLIYSLIINNKFQEKHNILLSVESILAIKKRVELIIDNWENELKDVIQKYLTTGEIDAEPEMLKKFTSYCTYYDIPYLQGGELINVNPFVNNQPAVPDIVLFILFKLQNNIC